MQRHGAVGAAGCGRAEPEPARNRAGADSLGLRGRAAAGGPSSAGPSCGRALSAGARATTLSGPGRPGASAGALRPAASMRAPQRSLPLPARTDGPWARILGAPPPPVPLCLHDGDCCLDHPLLRPCPSLPLPTTPPPISTPHTPSLSARADSLTLPSTPPPPPSHFPPRPPLSPPRPSSPPSPPFSPSPPSPLPSSLSFPPLLSPFPPPPPPPPPSLPSPPPSFPPSPPPSSPLLLPYSYSLSSPPSLPSPLPPSTSLPPSPPLPHLLLPSSPLLSPHSPCPSLPPFSSPLLPPPRALPSHPPPPPRVRSRSAVRPPAGSGAPRCSRAIATTIAGSTLRRSARSPRRSWATTGRRRCGTPAPGASDSWRGPRIGGICGGTGNAADVASR